MKDPNGKLNTHIKEVEAIFCLDERGYKGKAEARFTSDNNGETLSLSMGNLMFIVDFEDLIDLIEETRAERPMA